METTDATVRELLESASTASLSTCGPKGPWIAAVFFVSDPEFRVMFVSDPKSRHGRDLAACPGAALEVHGPASDWGAIRGVQAVGQVNMLTGAARDAGLRLYLRKFSDVARMTEAAEGSDERKIADRLIAATLYCFTPRWMRLIDNRRGFGFKAEVDLPPVPDDSA